MLHISVITIIKHLIVYNMLFGKWKNTRFKKIFRATLLPEDSLNRLWCFVTASKLEKSRSVVSNESFAFTNVNATDIWGVFPNTELFIWLQVLNECVFV